jgi:hypothetical protein
MHSVNASYEIGEMKVSLIGWNPIFFINMMLHVLFSFCIVNCRVLEDKASTFEDIVDAYLAYLQVRFIMTSEQVLISFSPVTMVSKGLS